MDSREPSAAPSSGGDTVDDQPEDTKPSIAELEHDESTGNLSSAVVGTPSSIRSKRGKGSTARKPRPKKGTHVWINDGPADGTEDEGAQTPSSRMKKSGSPDADGRTQGTAVGTRRQANGTVGSVYSGSKMRHIKKPDGTPLWRKEIQYEFLRLVIENTQPVFTRVSDKKPGCNFADIYIDCMARSSKTSKVLKDRLQVDRQAAQNMGMICLLVNVGRMNTTLNFFPEMRAQLRTYHSIPSLQAYESQKDYKSLQDAPRLKSILKGASEDTEEPRTLTAVKAAAIPRTNPVNLIFVLSQSAPEIAQSHFIDKVDFFDLAIRSTISSESRARAFLWLMWWYLEAPVHDRQTALNNPFGPGEFKDTEDPNDPNEVPLLVPKLQTISDEAGDKENEDPEEEKAFAEKMTRERKRLMAEVASGEFDTKEIEHKGVKRLRKGAKDSEDDSDGNSFRASPGMRRSPAVEGVMGMMSGGVGGSLGQADSLDDDWEAVDPHPGRGRYKRVKGKNTSGRSKMRVSETGSVRKAGGRASGLGFDRGTPDTVGARGTPQPLPPGNANHPVISQYSARRVDGDNVPTKSRARTGYQRQLEEHRNSRIEWLLKKKQKDMLKEARERRTQHHWIRKIARRVQDLDPTYDSEEDEDGTGLPPNGSMPGVNASLLGGMMGTSLAVPGIGVGGLIARRAIVSTTRTDDDGGENADANLHTVSLGLEEDDFGEEAESWLKIFQRTKRRLETWSGEKDYAIYIARKTGKKLPAGRYASKAKARVAIAGDSILSAMPPSAIPERITSSRAAGRVSTGRGGKGGRKSAGGVSGGRRALSKAATRGRSSSTTAAARQRRKDVTLDDEITQDLLAERSDDDEGDGDGDGDDDDADGDADADVDNEGDMDDDADGDIAMEDGANDDADGDGDGDGDVDVDDAEDSDIDMD